MPNESRLTPSNKPRHDSLDTNEVPVQEPCDIVSVQYDPSDSYVLVKQRYGSSRPPLYLTSAYDLGIIIHSGRLREINSLTTSLSALAKDSLDYKPVRTSITFMRSDPLLHALISHWISDCTNVAPLNDSPRRFRDKSRHSRSSNEIAVMSGS